MKIEKIIEMLNDRIAKGETHIIFATFDKGDVEGITSEDIEDRDWPEISERIEDVLEYDEARDEIRQHFEEMIDDIIAERKEDEEIQDEKDHKNGLYGEEY